MNFEPRSNVIESFVKFLRQKVDKGYEQHSSTLPEEAVTCFRIMSPELGDHVLSIKAKK